jgi:hypothetical protein
MGSTSTLRPNRCGKQNYSAVIAEQPGNTGRSRTLARCTDRWCSGPPSFTEQNVDYRKSPSLLAMLPTHEIDTLTMTVTDAVDLYCTRYGVPLPGEL